MVKTERFPPKVKNKTRMSVFIHAIQYGSESYS